MPNSSSSLNLWDGITRELKLLFPEDLYGMWFRELRCVNQSNDKLVLEAPNEFNAIWIESNYLDVITQQARAHAGTAITVTVQAEASSTTTPSNNRLDESKSFSQSGSNNRNDADRRNTGIAGKTHNRILINPRNTFQNFVIGQYRSEI